MARIVGVNIPLNKRVEIGLTYIYGIGQSTSCKILAELGIEPDRKVRDLTDDEVSKLRDIIDRDYVVEGDLRRERSQAIKRLMELLQFIREERSERESPTLGQTDVREVQDHPPARAGARDLLEPASQAASRLGRPWHEFLESTSP